MDIRDDLEILDKERDESEELLSDRPHSCSLRVAITTNSASLQRNGRMEE